MMSSNFLDSEYLLEAPHLPPFMLLRLKSRTYLSLKVYYSRSLLYNPKHFNHRLASVEQSLMPKPLIFCISIEYLAYIKAKHNTSKLRYGSQMCQNSAKLLLLKTECSISPFRSSS